MAPGDNRAMATRIVATAIAIVGLAFVAGAVALLAQATLGSALAAFLLGGFGLVILVAALFFLLVPSRVDRLHDLNVAYREEHGDDADGDEGQ